MTCKQCNGATELVDSNGGVKEGKFTERYQCVNCSAIGRVSGDASSPPSEWTYSGGVF